MKNSILSLIISSALSATSFAGVEEINVAPFLGEYKLIKAIKETNDYLTVRGSKCRDVLKISLSEKEDTVYISSYNLVATGITMNWIDLTPRESNTTISTDTLLKQVRTGGYSLFGLETKVELVTTIKKNNNLLSLNYEEIKTSKLSPRGRVVNVSKCLYEEVH